MADRADRLAVAKHAQRLMVGINAAISVIHPLCIVSREELGDVTVSLRDAGSKSRADDTACIWITVPMNGQRQRCCVSHHS